MLGLHPSLAPIKAGVFPLEKKDGMPEIAHKLADELRQRFPVFYDETGSIGRRYRRQDEVGTPFCITVDGRPVKDGTVTVRDRDTLQQERIAADALARLSRRSGCGDDVSALSLERLRREGEAFMEEISREYYRGALRAQGDGRAAADLREARADPRARRARR